MLGLDLINLPLLLFPCILFLRGISLSVLAFSNIVFRYFLLM